MQHSRPNTPGGFSSRSASPAPWDDEARARRAGERDAARATVRREAAAAASAGAEVAKLRVALEASATAAKAAAAKAAAAAEAARRAEEDAAADEAEEAVREKLVAPGSCLRLRHAATSPDVSDFISQCRAAAASLAASSAAGEGNSAGAAAANALGWTRRGAVLAIAALAVGLAAHGAGVRGGALEAVGSAVVAATDGVLPLALSAECSDEPVTEEEEEDDEAEMDDLLRRTGSAGGAPPVPRAGAGEPAPPSLLCGVAGCSGTRSGLPPHGGEGELPSRLAAAAIAASSVLVAVLVGPASGGGDATQQLSPLRVAAMRTLSSLLPHCGAGAASARAAAAASAAAVRACADQASNSDARAAACSVLRASFSSHTSERLAAGPSGALRFIASVLRDDACDHVYCAEEAACAARASCLHPPNIQLLAASCAHASLLFALVAHAGAAQPGGMAAAAAPQRSRAAEALVSALRVLCFDADVAKWAAETGGHSVSCGEGDGGGGGGGDASGGGGRGGGGVAAAVCAAAAAHPGKLRLQGACLACLRTLASSSPAGRAAVLKAGGALRSVAASRFHAFSPAAAAAAAAPARPIPSFAMAEDDDNGAPPSTPPTQPPPSPRRAPASPAAAASAAAAATASAASVAVAAAGLIRALCGCSDGQAACASAGAIEAMLHAIASATAAATSPPLPAAAAEHGAPRAPASPPPSSSEPGGGDDAAAAPPASSAEAASRAARRAASDGVCRECLAALGSLIASHEGNKARARACGAVAAACAALRLAASRCEAAAAEATLHASEPSSRASNPSLFFAPAPIPLAPPLRRAFATHASLAVSCLDVLSSLLGDGEDAPSATCAREAQSRRAITSCAALLASCAAFSLADNGPPEPGAPRGASLLAVAASAEAGEEESGNSADDECASHRALLPRLVVTSCAVAAAVARRSPRAAREASASRLLRAARDAAAAFPSAPHAAPLRRAVACLATALEGAATEEGALGVEDSPGWGAREAPTPHRVSSSQSPRFVGF